MADLTPAITLIKSQVRAWHKFNRQCGGGVRDATDRMRSLAAALRILNRAKKHRRTHGKKTR